MKRSINRMHPAAALLSAVIFAGPAYAADAVYEDTPVPSAPAETLPIATWSGIYGGITLGYGFGETEIPGNTIDTDGVVGSLFGGAQLQSGSFVYGVESDIGYSNMKGANAGTSVKGGIDGSLRARLGVEAMDGVLIYGTGGVAAGQVELTDAGGSDRNTLIGWTAGAGVDARLTDRLFGRLEYRHTDYATKTFTTGAVQGVDVKENKIQLGIGLHF